MDKNKGHFGLALVVITLIAMVIILNEYKTFLEMRNYSLFKTEDVGCMNCGFAASVGGFFVGIIPMMAIAFLIITLFSGLGVGAMVVLGVGYKWMIQGYGEKAHKIMLILGFITIAMLVYIIGMLINGEVLAAIEGRI